MEAEVAKRAGCRVTLVLLQAHRADLVEKADAATLVRRVEDQAVAGLGDHPECLVELPFAVAMRVAKGLAGDAGAIDADDRIVVEVAEIDGAYRRELLRPMLDPEDAELEAAPNVQNIALFGLLNDPDFHLNLASIADCFASKSKY